ncbi:MAG: fibronectin type III domain-containing protein, partial [Candidatus Limnocylindria bacterium]
GLSASAGNGSVSLTWTAPADDGGADVTDYEIYRRDPTGAEVVIPSPGTGLAYTDTGVANGSTYGYQVAALNSAGVGARSNEVTATPQGALTAPSAPRSLAAAKVRNAVRLTWSAPVSNGGTAITTYRIKRTAAGAETRVAEVAGTQLSYVDTTTERKVTYFYIVVAVNSVDEGPPSNEVSIRR